VASVTAQRLLAPVAGVGGWPGRLEALTPSEVEALASDSSPPHPVRGVSDPRPLPEDDRRVLRLLAVEGRMSFDLARAAEIPESTVRRRVADLIGGVLMFEVEVDPSLYGRRLDVWCWMDVQPSALGAVTGALAGHSEVAFAATTTGGTSIVAILELADATDLDRHLTERVGTLPGVMHVETDIAVRWIKRASPLIRRR
jgi:DNA-binding Lrp family transcriptional regulator